MALRRTRTVLLGITGLAIAGSMAGLGTFATFTDTTTSAAHTVATGTVDINIGVAGADNRLTVGATALVPGDTLQRRVKVTNAGTEALASVTLTSTATTSSILDTDATAGLLMKIQRCAGTVGWTESVTTPYTYTCDTVAAGNNLGTRTDVLAQRAIIGTTLGLTSMASLVAGATDDMVMTIELPSTTGNTFQNKSSTISYVFNATQRAATNK